MKTLQQCKDEVAQEDNFEDWDSIAKDLHFHYSDQAAILYAQECIKADRAALRKEMVDRQDMQTIDRFPIPELK